MVKSISKERWGSKIQPGLNSKKARASSTLDEVPLILILPLSVSILAVRFLPASEAAVNLNSPFEGVEVMVTSACFSKIIESSRDLKISILSKFHQPSSFNLPIPTVLSMYTVVRLLLTLTTSKSSG